MPRLVTPIGKLIYGSLIQPQTNDYGQTRWSAGLLMKELDAQPIAKAIETAIADKRARDPKFPTTNADLKIAMKPARDKQEDGTYVERPDEVVFTFQRKFEVNSKSGEKIRNSPPRIYDSAGSLIQDLQEVPFGSMGKVIYEVYPWSTPSMAGVQLQLHGFQIAELAVRDESIKPIEGGWVSESDQTQDISSLLAGA